MKEGTKCPYCGRNVLHGNSFPQTTVFEMKHELWEPRLISKIHDARQPYKCNGCGAEFKLDISIERQKFSITSSWESSGIHLLNE